MLSKCFKIEPYGIVVEVVKELPKDVQKTANITDQTLGLTWPDDKDEFTIYVWFAHSLFCKVCGKYKAQQSSIRQSIVVHEAIHIKQFAEKAIGTKFDDETEAYLVQKTVEDLQHTLSSIYKTA